MSKTVNIDADKIQDWETFHDVFAKELGFPDFYGRNMDAWIDCLTYLDEDDGMRNISVSPGEMLTLVVCNSMPFKERCPEQYAALVECADFVNYRRIEAGDKAVLKLALE